MSFCPRHPAPEVAGPVPVKHWLAVTFGRWPRPRLWEAMNFLVQQRFLISQCALAFLLASDLNAMVDGDRLIADVSFGPPILERSRFAPGFYHVSVIDAVSFGDPGFPSLPQRRLLLVVPEGKTVDDLIVVPGNKIACPGLYPVEPGQKLYPGNLAMADRPPVDQPDGDVYGLDSVYPQKSARIATIQKKDGYSLVAIVVCPVEYNPKRQSIAYYQSLQIVLRLVPERPALSVRNAPPIARRTAAKAMAGDLDRIRELVDNKEDVPVSLAERGNIRGLQAPRIGPIADGQYDYVIITSSALASAFEPLRAFRAQNGLAAAIVTTDWIYTNYSGARPSGGQDDATRIRNFIIDAYHNWGTQFVLLGGSAHRNPGASPVVPVRGLSDPATGSDQSQNYADNDIPADLYYACLDGSFDANANGIYGEPDDGEDGGEVDLLAEVDVGRAPVTTPQEASIFVKKTIQYETAGEGEPWLEDNYLLGVNFLGADTDSATYSTAFMEKVRLGSESGLRTRGFLSNPDRGMEARTLYDRPGYFWSAADVVRLINQGVHILNYDGHGANYSDMRMTPADLQSISNARPFIVFSGSCYSASFDNRRADLGYSHGNSIAEQFLTKADGGAVAYIGNSRFGWDFTSEFYNCAFWDVLFGRGISQLGRMNLLSKEMALPYFYFPLMRWVYLDQNLLGDPGLRVHVPNRLILEPVSQSIGFRGVSNDINLSLGLSAFNQDAHDISLTLSSSDPNVTIGQRSLSCGDILKGQIVQTPAPGFSFRLSSSVKLPCEVDFFLDISASGYNSRQTVHVLISGPAGPPVVQFFLFETGASGAYALSNSRRVGLLFDTTLPNPGLAGVGQMQFSNDNTNWSEPEPFVQTKVDWELSPGDGVKIVYARFANALGDWSQVASRPIILDTTPPTGSLAVQEATESSVSLCLYAQDALSAVQTMKFSFDGRAWSPGMTFATTKVLKLPIISPPADTVYVKYQDLAGNWSEPCSASIQPAQTGVHVGIRSDTGGSVTVTMSLRAGVTYQLQSSSDLLNWTAVGLPFLANTGSMSEEFVPSTSVCYWRLLELK